MNIEFQARFIQSPSVNNVHDYSAVWRLGKWPWYNPVFIKISSVILVIVYTQFYHTCSFVQSLHNQDI